MESNIHFKNYDTHLISVLEVVGSYYVDIFYNIIYNLAKTHVSKGGGSITDDYRRQVQSYILGVRQEEKCYRDAVGNLHKYFQTRTRYSSLNFPDFVDKIVSQFMPVEYYKSIKTSEKDEFLSSILCDLIAALGGYMTRPDILPRIIDDRDKDHEVTIRMLQDHSIYLQITARDRIHNQFFCKLGQTKDMVSVTVVDDLKKAIRQLVKDKSQMAVTIEDTTRELKRLTADFQKSKLQWREKESKYNRLLEMVRSIQDKGISQAAHQFYTPPINDIAESSTKRSWVYDANAVCGEGARANPPEENTSETDSLGPSDPDPPHASVEDGDGDGDEEEMEQETYEYEGIC